jgi:N-methylhydantoinase A
MLKVGPRSAGARPGPACYGHGGTDPAITDALVQLGWIRPHRFLGGKMALHLDRAAKALATLGPSASESAHAMIDIATAHIGQGIRLVSVQRGHDAKNFALYGYGGMGPMMSALAAEDLKIRRVVIPPYPGLFSALGLLVSDLKRIYRETNLMQVDEHASRRVAASFERMRERAVEEFTRLGRDRDELVFDHALEMRYSGQGFELLTEIDLDELSAQGQEYLERLFNGTHMVRYGSVSRDPVEIVTLRLVAQIPSDGNALRELTRGPSGDASPEIEESAVTFRGARMQCQFAWRSSLPKGHVLNGPAIVEEPTATTLVPPGWRSIVHQTGSLILEKETQA